MSEEKFDIGDGPKHIIPDAAKRALVEARQRRELAEAENQQPATEINGRKGPDPARYGDWEKKGIAIDF